MAYGKVCIWLSNGTVTVTLCPCQAVNQGTTTKDIRLSWWDGIQDRFVRFLENSVTACASWNVLALWKISLPSNRAAGNYVLRYIFQWKLFSFRHDQEPQDQCCKTAGNDCMVFTVLPTTFQWGKQYQMSVSSSTIFWIAENCEFSWV